MAERTIFPEWRKSNETTAYPFSAAASLINDAGTRILAEMFLDAALTVIGATDRLYLSSVEVTHAVVTLVIGDIGTPRLATGTFFTVNPPAEVPLTDLQGRPAGVLISEPARLSILASWGVGTHDFRVAQSEFAAAVCFPSPEPGLRGVLLPSGELLVGDVWLVGGEGRDLTDRDRIAAPINGQEAKTVRAIRVDIVGDPLYRRRLCNGGDGFTTPRFVRAIRFRDESGFAFEATPDADGNIRLFANSALARDTVLRATTTADGLRISAVGSPTTQ